MEVTPKQFAKYEARDKYCPHCGQTAPYLVPHHRSNRGFGGYKKADRPSNIIAICAILNGAMESDSETARQAQEYGWKISRYADPVEVPIWDSVAGEWWLLTDDYNRLQSRNPHQT